MRALLKSLPALQSDYTCFTVLLLFSPWIMPNSLQPHELQHTWILCPLPSPRVCSNSCSLNWWCISNHLIFCCPLLLLPSLSQLQRLFQWVGSSHQVAKNGVSASASVLPMNIQGWFPFRLTGFISLLSKTLSRVFASTTVWKHQLFSTQPSLWEETLTSVHDYGKTIALTIQTFVSKVMPLLFYILSRFVIVFLPRSKNLNFMAAVTIYSDLGAQENKNLPPFLLLGDQIPWS